MSELIRIFSGKISPALATNFLLPVFMNLEEVKRAGPSYLQFIHWGFCAYCKYLKKHPDYEIAEGDILIYLVGRFPDELTAVPVGIYTPHAGTRLLRIGVFNADTFQG